MTQHFDQYHCFAASTSRQSGNTVIAYNALLGANGIKDLTHDTYDLTKDLNIVILNKEIPLTFRFNLEEKLYDFTTKYQDGPSQDLKDYIELFTKAYHILLGKFQTL